VVQKLLTFVNFGGYVHSTLFDCLLVIMIMIKAIRPDE